MSEPINDIVTAWVPEQDPHVIATLGKLAEEASELAGRASRCIIQGLDEQDPETLRSNRDELGREAADVLACLDQLAERLNVAAPALRRFHKDAGFDRWHALIDQQLADRRDAK